MQYKAVGTDDLKDVDVLNMRSFICLWWMVKYRKHSFKISLFNEYTQWYMAPKT